MRVAAFGDSSGVTQLVQCLPAGMIVAVVGAEIRPQYFDALERIAKSIGVPFLIQARRNSSAYASFVRALSEVGPELIVVNSYSMRLHPDVLTLASHGGINIHGALLPQYRGANPIQWAMLNNERETGVTIHYMTEEIDAGDIIAQRRLPIYFVDTWRDVQARISAATESLICKEFPGLLGIEKLRRPQDRAVAHHYRRRGPEDGFINWQQSVVYIYNLIRALVKPHPGAFYFEEDKKVVLDEYLTIGEVVGLKYGSAGGQLLISSQIELYPLSANDLAEALEWAGRQGDAGFRLLDKPPIDSDYKSWCEHVHRRMDVVIFGVRRPRVKGLIGLCGLYGIDWDHDDAEMRITIDQKDPFSSEDSTEAIQLLLRFGFEELLLRRVHAHALSKDVVQCGVYKALGFVCEGSGHQAAVDGGGWSDVSLISILKEKYGAEKDSGYSPT